MTVECPACLKDFNVVFSDVPTVGEKRPVRCPKCGARIDLMERLREGKAE